MKLSYSGKLLACLGGSAIALLPMTNVAAEPAASAVSACAKGACAAPVTNASQRTFLGVLVQPITPSLAEAFGMKDNAGALVAEVMQKSPAENAGLQQGDVIIAIDGKAIADGAALQKTIAAQEGGAKVEIRYIRDGRQKEMQAELGGTAPQKNRSAAADDGAILGGVNVADVSDKLRQKFNLPENAGSVIITAVEEDSAAHQAGLRVGDVIRQIDRKEVRDAREAAALSDSVQDQNKVIVLVWSKGASRFTVLEQNA